MDNTDIDKTELAVPSTTSPSDVDNKQGDNEVNEVMEAPMEPLPVEAPEPKKKKKSTKLRTKDWWKDGLKGVGGGPDLDDRTMIGEHIENMSDSSPIVRATAAEFAGRIAEKHGAEFVIVCGAIDQLKQCLYDDSPLVVRMASLSIAAIARTGGTDVLLDSGIGEVLKKIALSPHHRRFEKDAAAMALGWIFMSTFLDEPVEP